MTSGDCIKLCATCGVMSSRSASLRSCVRRRSQVLAAGEHTSGRGWGSPTHPRARERSAVAEAFCMTLTVPHFRSTAGGWDVFAVSLRGSYFLFEDATTGARQRTLRRAITAETTIATVAVTARADEFNRGVARHWGPAAAG